MIPRLPEYEFIAPRKIVFGWGRRRELGSLLRPLASRALVVVGSRVLLGDGTIDALLTDVREAGVDVLGVETISREPEVEDVDRVTNAARQYGARPGDAVVAIGGGSAIDLAKAVAAMTVQSGETVKDYLEGVGCGLTLDAAPLPVVALPTTSGTGAEATKNAVISNYDPPFKKSLRDDRMMPSIALVDPELTTSAPRDVTLHGGMDAVTQLIESYVSCRAKPIPKALAEEGLRLALPAIAVAVEDGSHRKAREAMAHAAMLSGVCLANSGLGMAHGVAPALGVHCRVPHGLACAVMLPVAMKANCVVAEADFARLGRLFASAPSEAPDAEAAAAFCDMIIDLCRRLGVPSRLSEIGVPAEKIPDIVQGSRGNSMRGNPREIGDEELTRLLEAMA